LKITKLILITFIFKNCEFNLIIVLVLSICLKFRSNWRGSSWSFKFKKFSI